MQFYRVLPAALTLALTFAAVPSGLSAQSQAPAETPAAGEDPIVARVNGEEIRQSAVFALAGTLPQQFQSQIIQIYPVLVQRLVDFRLANAAGRAEGLAEDKEVKARLAELEDRVIREIWIERAIEKRMTEDALRTRYTAYLAENPPVTEQNARHILLESEEEARDILAKLDGGADFAELAKEHSTGPSGPRGGDLGYFTEDQMVPEFSAVASALQPGEYSKDPVQTQFGWHVIKLEDRRDLAPPSFEDVEPRLRQDFSRENAEIVLKDLRDAAEVEITPAGTAMAPAGVPAGAAQ